MEELVYQPKHDLSDKQVDQFLVLARSVGTFGRALDCASTVRQPSLHMSAAAASRDITLVCISLHLIFITIYLVFYYLLVFGVVIGSEYGFMFVCYWF